MKKDEFVLYDLRIDVVGCAGNMVCNHTIGDYFEVSGESLTLPPDQSFSLYALAAILPLLPAKQRLLQKADWMSTDEVIACPDPNCGARFKITRTQKRIFKHSETTIVPLEDSK
jgi:uncharacterized repeat protein (TIGR04076 family)